MPDYFSSPQIYALIRNEKQNENEVQKEKP